MSINPHQQEESPHQSRFVNPDSMVNKISQEELSEMIQLRAQNWSIEQIAKQMGRAVSTVSLHLSKARENLESHPLYSVIPSYVGDVQQPAESVYVIRHDGNTLPDLQGQHNANAQHAPQVYVMCADGTSHAQAAPSQPHPAPQAAAQQQQGHVQTGIVPDNMAVFPTGNVQISHPVKSVPVMTSPVTQATIQTSSLPHLTLPPTQTSIPASTAPTGVETPKKEANVANQKGKLQEKMRLTEEERDEILRLRNENYTGQEIADRVGVSMTSVFSIIKKAENSPSLKMANSKTALILDEDAEDRTYWTGRATKICPQKLQEMIRLRSKNVTIANIAKRIGCSNSTVFFHLSKAANRQKINMPTTEVKKETYHNQSAMVTRQSDHLMNVPIVPNPPNKSGMTDKSNRLTPEEKDEIINLRSQNYSIEQIAELIGCSRSTVSANLNKASIAKKPKPKKAKAAPSKVVVDPFDSEEDLYAASTQPPVEEEENEADNFKNTWTAIGQKLHVMRQKDILCDAKLAGSDFDDLKTVVSAHSLILSASSEFFYKVFVTNRTSLIKGQLISLKNINTAVLKTSINFLYGTQPENLTELQQLKAGAEVLGLSCAKVYLSNFDDINTNITADGYDNSTEESCIDSSLSYEIISGTDIFDVENGVSKSGNSRKGLNCPVCLMEMEEKVMETHIVNTHLSDVSDGTNLCPVCEDEIDGSITAISKHIVECHVVRPRIQSLRPRTRKTKTTNRLQGQFKRKRNLLKVQMFNRKRVNKIKRTAVVEKTDKISLNPEKCQTCSTCLKEYTDRFQFLLHLHKDHEQRKYFVCCVCARRFNFHTGAVFHMKSEHGIDGTYTQLRGLKSIITPLNINNIVPLHSAVENSTADKLTEWAATWLTDHFPCPHCNQIFATADDLSDDIRQHLVQEAAVLSSLKQGEHECHSCGEMYETSKSLAKHKYAVHVERYVCKYCQRRFHAAYNLELHVKIHQDKSYVCSICGRAFTQRQHLQGHLKTHSSVHEYTCNECGKQFRFKQGLKAHFNRWHNPDYKRNFVCEVCGFRCHNRTRLAHHRTKHSDARPHICMHCGKTFKTPTYLKYHIKKHHEAPIPAVTAAQPTVSSSMVAPRMQDIPRHGTLEIPQVPHISHVPTQVTTHVTHALPHMQQLAHIQPTMIDPNMQNADQNFYGQILRNVIDFNPNM